MKAVRVNSDLGFSLPGVVTQTTAILGIRGSGKTNTGTVIVEELLDQGFQVVVIDPTDVWWGLRADALGGPHGGFPVVVLGGDHADLDLAEDDGGVLADFIVDHHAPCILSLRHLRKAAQRRFVATFLEQLYHRKGKAEHRRPLLVVFDEASTFVPQRVTGDVARCVGAIEDLVRRGRASGFGVMLIDQRPASVNKDVLTQLEVLVAHRVTSPQDRKALDEWVKAHDSAGHRTRFLADLASLERGEAYFWAPGLDVFSKAQVRLRSTFDSSKTPELGEDYQRPSLAMVDLDALKASLGSVVEQRRMENPDHLHTRIKELEAEVERLREIIDKRSAKDAAAQGAVGPLRDIQRRLDEVVLAIVDNADAAGAGGPGGGFFIHPDVAGPELDRAFRDQAAAINAPAEPTQVIAIDMPAVEDRPAPEVNAPQQRILDALRRLEDLGIHSLARAQVAAFSDQSPKSSAFLAHLSHLKNERLIHYPASGYVALTQDGRDETFGAAADSPVEALADLHRAFYRLLRPPSRVRVLRELVQAYPDMLGRELLAQRANQSPRSSAYLAHLSALKGLGLIEYPSTGFVIATDLLFPKELTP